jgi:arsenate reductase
MRKQKVLFLCTQNSARSQMAEAFLRNYAGDRFEAYSAGCEVGDEIHPYAAEVMDEVGIDISDQYPKGLKTYMGKMGFNYSIIVCARAERNCPKTFPGVGTRLVWIFDDPRAEDVPEEEMLEKFREVRDRIEQKILDWLERPEEELAKLREEREQERRERFEAARREAESREVFAVAETDGVHFLERIAYHGVDIGGLTVFLVTGERIESAMRQYLDREPDEE